MNRKPRSCHELGVCTGRRAVGCSCQHDTADLAPGDYYFAPGTVERGVQRTRRLSGWRRFVMDLILLLAVAGIVGFLAGYAQAKGFFL